MLQRKTLAQAETTISRPSSDTTRELVQLRAKMDRDIQELYRENILAEEAGARAQLDHERKEQDLLDRLQDVRRELEIIKRALEDTQRKVLALEEDLSRSRKGELRYKKKVTFPLKLATVNSLSRSIML